MAKARVAKLCTQVEYTTCWPWDDKLPPNGRGQDHMTILLILATNDIFGISEVQHFKFCAD